MVCANFVPVEGFQKETNPGHWDRRPHPRAIWVNGQWKQHHESWYWVDGHWK